MKRGPGYPDENANPYAASQMQHMSGQIMQQNSASNSFPGRSDSLQQAEDERRYVSTKSEGQWEWDRDAQQMSPHLYSDGQGGTASRSFYPSQIPETKLASNQSGLHPQEQNMEIGYEENTSQQTLEGIERKFRDDIMKLTKEHVDAEDSENTRHRERIVEINNQYQENLSALRARHAAKREEFLQKESQKRLQQYQLAGVTRYQKNSGPSDMAQDPLAYGGPPGLVPGEPQRQYSGAQFDSYRQQQPESFGRGRMLGPDTTTRVPTPGGRVYNTSPRYY